MSCYSAIERFFELYVASREHSRWTAGTKNECESDGLSPENSGVLNVKRGGNIPVRDYTLEEPFQSAQQRIYETAGGRAMNNRYRKIGRKLLTQAAMPVRPPLHIFASRWLQLNFSLELYEPVNK
jgi:hypothetical protein